MSRKKDPDTPPRRSRRSRKPASTGAPRRKVANTKRRSAPRRSRKTRSSSARDISPRSERRASPKRRKSRSRQSRPTTRSRSRSRQQAPPSGGWLARLGRLSFSALLGALVGGSAVVYVLYHQAVVDVEALLAQDVFTPSGRVLSAPMSVWTGMRISSGQLAADLQSAGYARVRSLQAAGDFVVSPERVQVLDETGRTISVGFSDGRITTVQPGPVARFGAVELAELRGPEGISRRPITVDELPEHVYQPILAMEDARFFDHEGVDPIGITRAVVANITAGDVSQGGSTLTQQLVKNLFLSAERTYERKAREALLAVALENTRTKKQILELYLNEIYLGQIGAASIAGVDQAARAYFGKGAERLEVGEAAVLAGIISAPNRYSPLRHPERTLAQRDKVLKRMQGLGWLSEARLAEELARPLQLAPTPTSRQSPWMVEAAVEHVEAAVEEPGVVSGQGWVVQTTLQPALQRIAERVVAESLAALEEEHDVEGAEMALVALRASDGAVLAMVGGRDYATSQFNRATSASRQVGSTVKPLSYLAALDRDHTQSPGSIVDDAPLQRTVNRKTWAPKNYDGRYVGPISYRDALAQSRNVPAVLVAESVGMEALSSWWKSAGLEEATAYPSAALGSFSATPLAMAGAYTVFPNLGTVSAPRMVSAALDAEGTARYTLAPDTARVASPEAAWLVSSMLSDVITRGTARSASRLGLDGPAAGKTGTTDEARDAWFVGYTGDVVVAVWVGHDRKDALGLTGGKAALPAWTRFVVDAGFSLSLPEPPAGVVQTTLCAETGRPATCGAPCEEAVEEWVYADMDLCAEDDADGSAVTAAANPLRDAISRLLDGTTEASDGPPTEDPDDEAPRRRIFPRRDRNN